MILSKRKIIKIKYISQGNKSGLCGGYALKMLLDYYQCKNRQQRLYSIKSLRKELHYNREYGVEEKSIEEFLKKRSIPFLRLRPHQLLNEIQNNRPVLTCFKDELFEGHYAVINGFLFKQKDRENQELTALKDRMSKIEPPLTKPSSKKDRSAEASFSAMAAKLNPSLFFMDPWPDFGPMFERNYQDYISQLFPNKWIISLQS